MVNHINKLAIVILLILLGFSTYSQPTHEKPTEWRISHEQVDDTTVMAIFHVKLAEKWKIYGYYQEPESDVIATRIEYEDSNIKVLEVIEEGKKTSYYDKYLLMQINSFAPELTIKQRLSVPLGITTVSGSINYQVCLEQCIFDSKEFTLEVREETQAAPTERKTSRNTWSSVAKEIGDNNYQVTHKSKSIESIQSLDGDVIIYETGTFLQGRSIEEKKDNQGIKYTITDTVQLAQSKSEIKATIAYIQQGDSTLLEEEVVISLESLWFTFGLAFLIGLGAIFTPCVYPIIPMTISIFMKTNSKAKARFQALFFGFSILFIYTVLGILFAIIFGDDFVQILSTHWVSNALFFLIFVVFACSFFGMFELTLPSWIANKSDQKAEKGGLLAPFFMAFTLVIVSFSCTGPLAGTALVSAAQGSILAPAISMLGFASPFAIIFTLFALFPSMLKSLPKSGGWLNSVKVVFGFLELMFALKFLSNVDLAVSGATHFLSRDFYLALWIVLLILMGFYLLGKLRFAHDSPLSYISVPRLILAVFSFSFAVYLIPGMFGAPLRSLSGILPPIYTQVYNVEESIKKSIQQQATYRVPIGTEGNQKMLADCVPPRYADFLSLPDGFTGYFDYQEALACARAQNKPLFIDFTGEICANCRRMEEHVWTDERVRKILHEEYVIVAIYEDVTVDLPEDRWITQNGKTIRQLGKVNREFQKERYGFYATPYYALVGPDGEDLVPGVGVELDPDKFLTFLKKGVERYNELHKTK